mgnify:CR=1 FL=1
MTAAVNHFPLYNKGYFNLRLEEFGMYKFKNKEYVCLIEMALDLIGEKWKSLILWNLYNSTLRYNRLKREIPDITQKMLTQQLRELEDCGLVYRHSYPQTPPKVEYSLTDDGKKLVPALEPLHNWGKAFIEKNGITINHNKC